MDSSCGAFVLAGHGVFAGFGGGGEGEFGVSLAEPADACVSEFADDEGGVGVEVLGGAMAAAVQELLAALIRASGK